MIEVPGQKRSGVDGKGGVRLDWPLTAASRAAVAVGVPVFLPSLPTSNQSTAPWPVDQIDGQIHALLHSFHARSITMDLRAMLNEPSQAQRHQPQTQTIPHPPPPPRLHTHHSQSSYDHTLSYEPTHNHTLTPSLERPPLLSSTSSYHGQPPPTSEYRTSANGSYFGVQSPHQHQKSASASASTPTATGPPMYAQSPGPHTIHTPREGIPPSHPFQSPFVPSPSPSGQYPPTPGSVHHYPTTATSSTATSYQYSSAHPSLTGQSPIPREDYISANGNAHTQQRNFSPQAQFHPPPVTPLGPPVSYPRPSPHPHRPTSHGQESARRSSIGSVGSVQSRDYNQPPYDHSRTGSGSVQRTFPGDVRERERSIESVSPKTIPKPPPVRRQSVTRYQEPMSDPYAMAQPSPAPNSNSSIAQSHTTPDRVFETQHYDTTPKSSSTSIEPRSAAQYRHSEPSPAPSTHNNSVTPQPAHTTLPAQQTPVKSQSQASLKRTASNISDVTTTPLHPRKRVRRDDIPIWAQSARKYPLSFINARPPSPPPSQQLAAPINMEVAVKKETEAPPMTNGQGQSHATTPPGEVPWEPSIINEAAFDDLTRRVCDWILFTIGDKQAPAGGAMFEIEAKVGMIFDEGTGDRLRLPVLTETVFNRRNYGGRTSFKSSMNVVSIARAISWIVNADRENRRSTSIST